MISDMNFQGKGLWKNNLYIQALRFGAGLTDQKEQNRRRSRGYVEDFVIEDRSKMPESEMHQCTSYFSASPKGCVVIVADDMGKSESVNRAIAEAHDEGILTAASIMAGGEAFDDAAHTALERSRLSPGLHLTLCDGKAVLPHSSIPDITDHDGNFIKDPFSAGLHYTRPGLLAQIEAEVAAQFERLERAGIRPHHVDGHHHLHMHPVIFEVLCRQASRRDICWIRLPNEPLSMVKAFRSPSRGTLPFVEWAVFGILGKYNARTARKYGMLSAARVCGLSRTGNIDEQFFLDIMELTGTEISEIFTHPDTATPAGRLELAALVSPSVYNLIKELHKLPVGYKDFTAPKKS